jgi:hypothetical protein
MVNLCGLVSPLCKKWCMLAQDGPIQDAASRKRDAQEPDVLNNVQAFPPITYPISYHLETICADRSNAYWQNRLHLAVEFFDFCE